MNLPVRFSPVDLISVNPNSSRNSSACSSRAATRKPRRAGSHRCGLMNSLHFRNVGYFQKDFTLAKSACAF